MNFSDVFQKSKPVIGMLHLGGETPSEVVDIAKREAEIMYKAGVAAVLAENYFGDRIDVGNTLKMLQPVGRSPGCLEKGSVV